MKIKKNLVIGFFILGALAYGENKLGNDIQKNEKILSEMRLENRQLKDKLTSLKEELTKLESGLIKVIKYEDQGIIITRKPDVFVVSIKNGDYSDEKYVEFFDAIIETMKYDKETPITIVGSTDNNEVISNYFINNGVDKNHLILEERSENLNIVEIIFKQKEEN